MPNHNIQTLYIIVPVFNEYNNLETLFESLKTTDRIFHGQSHLRIIFVDDGSTDGTGERANQLAGNLNLTVLSHERNLGPGRAFGTAFAYLAQKLDDNDWVVTMEGDNTSRYEVLEHMFIRKEEGYDTILASPYMYGGGIQNTTSLRVILSGISNLFVKEFLGIHGILTASSFYRLHNASTIKKLQDCYGPNIIELDGFECMVEMLLKMIYFETKISEVPMLLDTSLRIGKSKMKIMRTIMGYFKVLYYKKRWFNMSLNKNIKHPQSV